ncbi:helix-turn-helix domain-containing protein [Amphritea sp. 2_MG-2023]|jgi:transcriptional regulator GlxA family with amidase domain|uniref:GlxA family transcriptional regulator n=1 Tax=Amphritea TaxID=515417 RepID=UPI001C0729AE|nr:MULTISPECIES: helix-turn-helix domain-containing protein [Amphritea]MBU2965688.1 helix-turn-helix domain-containing protein [Amphritea atlantica]MDO6417244.1 helix-turn-helix domain-containing protein [Amphritea sp. 2_MG-2023]MDX2423917.1 helix-turn-helix domain-containing protein [Amphritea sp.]
MYKVIGLAFDGCQATGLTSPFDVFNVVNSIWKQTRGEDVSLYECQLASRDGGWVTCSNGMRIMADVAFTQMPEADLIVIPGIHHLDVRSLLKRLAQLDEECRWLSQYIQRGIPVAANCSGVFLLGDAGGLAGKRATTAWWLGKAFRDRYPAVEHCADTMLVNDQGAYTSGSMTANLGAMLALVEQQVGRHLAQSAARNMLIDAAQSTASPYVFMQANSDHQDSLVLAVESQLQRDVSHKLCLQTLANNHAVSVRTLARRFKAANGISVADYQQQLRFEQTKLLLETTSLSLEKIVERVGYASQSSLRRLFQKALGESPSRFRKRVQQKGAH